MRLVRPWPDPVCMRTNLAHRGLASQEMKARAALYRLHECSREIERMTATARAVGDSAATQMPALRAQARRARAAIRDWDGDDGRGWSERVQTQLGLLAADIRRVADANAKCASAEPAFAVVGSKQRVARSRLSTEEVEARVYRYLYSRTPRSALG